MTDTAQTIVRILEESPRLLEDWRPEHTPIQLQHFVVENSSHGTRWGAYVQAMRELAGRVDGLHNMVFDAREREIDCRETKLMLDREIEHRENLSSVDDHDHREAAIAVERAQLAYDRATHAREAEKTRRESAAREAANVLALAIEARRPLGVLDDAKRTELEWEFWKARMLTKILVHSMTGAPVGEELLLTLGKFPRRHRLELQNALKAQPNELIETYAAKLGLEAPKE